MYYDLSKILSYNAFLNFIIAERGVGKTFSASDFVTKQFIKKDYEFAYIRRYKSELKKSVPDFFKALVKEGKHQGHNLETKGENFYIDGKKAGYGMTLSTAHNLKSANFSNVKYIIFDEFLIEEGQGHYLANEVENFLGLIETIARMRDVIIICLGNAVTVANPYFIFFDITIPYKSDIKTYKDGLILVNYVKNLKYREEKKKTKFGRLTEGTEFSKYAIDNNFRMDNKDFIEKKTGSARYSFGMIYKDHIFGVWFDFNAGKIFISNDYNENGQMFACTLQDHRPNTMLINSMKNYTAWKTFIQNYKLGNVYYENMKIKQQVKDLLKIFLTR